MAKQVVSGVTDSHSKDHWTFLKASPFWSANRASATVLCTCDHCQIEPRTRRNRDPASIAPKAKNTGFRARECFSPVNSHVPEVSLLFAHDTGMMTDWPWPLDIRPQLGSLRTKLPVTILIGTRDSVNITTATAVDCRPILDLWAEHRCGPRCQSHQKPTAVMSSAPLAPTVFYGRKQMRSSLQNEQTFVWLVCLSFLPSGIQIWRAGKAPSHW